MIDPLRGCRHCGFHVPPDAALCPGCNRPAWDDWRQRARRAARVARRARRLDPPLHDRGYRSLLQPATRARAALRVTTWAAAASAVAFGAAAVAGDGTRSAARGVELVPVTQAAAALLVSSVLGVATLVRWAVPATRNAPALAIGCPSSRVAWFAGRWVIAVAPSLAAVAVVVARGGLVAFAEPTLVSVGCAAGAATVSWAAAVARRTVGRVTISQARRVDVLAEVRDSGTATHGHRIVAGTMRR